MKTCLFFVYPVWFIIVEIMITGALIAQLVGLIFAIVYISSACAPQHEHFTLLIAGIMQSVSGNSSSICLDIKFFCFFFIDMSVTLIAEVVTVSDSHPPTWCLVAKLDTHKLIYICIS